jgi:hypothetical protein
MGALVQLLHRNREDVASAVGRHSAGLGDDEGQGCNSKRSRSFPRGFFFRAGYVKTPPS